MSDAIVNAQAGGLSEMERVVDVFVAPSKTFKDIVRNANWWMPFLLMVAFSVASAFVVGKEVGWTRAAENQVHMSPKAEDRLSQLTPEQRASQMAISAKVTMYTTYGFPVILTIIFAIYALVVWGSFNFGLGAQTTYGQVLAVSWYAALPFLITSVLGMITVSFGGNADAYDLRNPVGTNLAYYLPDLSPVLKALLTQFDLVRLWSLFLTILGMSIVAKKTMAQSAMVVLFWWVFGLAFAAIGAAFS